MQYAKSKSISYHEVSAKTGQNVTVAFSSMVSEVYKAMNLDPGNDKSF